MIKHLTIFVLSGLLCTSFLRAQATSETMVCQEHSCHNDPTPVSVMTSHVHRKNEVMLSYRFMNMDMKGIYAGTQAVDKNEVFNNYLAAPDKMRMQMHMIMAMYGVTNRLTAMAMLNYNTNSMAMSLFTKSGHVHAGATGDTSGVHHMNTSGVSDIKLNVLYNVLNVSNQQLIVSAGVSLPFGNIKTKGAADDAMYPNRNYAYSMQLGSGTYDFLPCVSYWVQKNKATFSAQLSSVIRMNTNALGYKLGNEYGLNTWFGYQSTPFLSHSIRLEGNVTDKIVGIDPTLYAFNEPSANAANYGGQRVSCAVGSVFHFNKGVLKNNRLGVEYSVPMYQNLKGIQMPLRSCLTLAWSIAL